MRIFARHSLVPCTLAGGESALVLEGDWPEQIRSARRWSLDRQIHARHAWIDHLASELAERMTGEPVYRLPCAKDRTESSLSWINALALRYYFVKLLRVVAFFQSEDIDPAEPLLLTFQSNRDEDYRRLIDAVARAQGRNCEFEAVPNSVAAPAQASSDPANSALRRFAGELNRVSDSLLQALQRRWHPKRSGQLAPILLCGNPRVLDPVCRELRYRRLPACWLYDRFAFGNWFTWRRRGVLQLVCNSNLAAPIALTDTLSGKWMARGVDLASTLQVWLERTARQRGAAQHHLWTQIEMHFDLLQPSAVVLDEDATPLKRIAIAMARHRGVPSLVVQHGAPRVRFGFAPLAADGFLAWGQASRDQLRGWGVLAEKIAVTGSPHDWPDVSHKAGSRSILLFTTVPPGDARPDAVEYHLTRQTHDELIHLACAAVARLPGFELVIKLHPRVTNLALFESIARSHQHLRFRIVRDGSFENLLADAACVLNCGSSAGIEAASYGWPVIELLPAGSVELTPALRWGMLGAASSSEQLDALLRQALEEPRIRSRRPQAGDVFAAVGNRAAARIVDEILSAIPMHPTPAPCNANPSHAEAGA